MKLKGNLVIFFIISIFILLTSCNNLPPEKDNNNEKIQDENNGQSTNNKELNAAIRKLLPNRENYKWLYSGFAEYGHEMDLKSIVHFEDKTIYSIKGKVFDPSGGESKGDFNLDITYVIDKGKLIQIKKGEYIMDSVFDEIILINGALEKGNEWEQNVTDKKGNEHTLKCRIEDIQNDNGKKLYFVTYNDTGSDYYERRMIKEGVGVVEFERLQIDDENSYTIGYALYEERSGYIDKLEMEKYLPPLEKRMYYYGLAEYGHSGVLKEVSRDNIDATFEFAGKYEDGSGLGGEFKVLYVFDYINGEITEKVTQNTRTDKKKVNSIIPNLVILKLPMEVGNSWVQEVKIDDKNYIVNSEIVQVSYKDLSYYLPQNNEKRPVVKVRYIINDIEGYFNNTYIEEREFQVGKGMISFKNLMKRELPITEKDLQDPYAVNREIINNMFGYGLSHIE